MEHAFQSGHRLLDERRRRRNEVRVPGPCSADPVLRPSKLARLLLAPAPPREQLLVHLANEAVRERKASAQPRHAVLERGHVVRHLHHIVERHAGRLLELEQQEVGQGRLRALDLRRQHRLAPDVGVEKELRIRQQGRDAVEPAQRQRRFFEQALPCAAQLERRLRRQRVRNEGADFLSPTVVVS